MPLDFPVVPINTEAKVFALNDLHDAIKNLAVHQSTVGNGMTPRDTEGDKKRQQAEAYRKILAELERRNAFDDQAQPTGPDESGFMPSTAEKPVSEGPVPDANASLTEGPGISFDVFSTGY